MVYAAHGYSGPGGPGLRGRGARRRRPVGLASLRWSIPLTPDGPSGPWLREGAAKPRRPVGLASLRSEPERDGGGIAEER
ncbi:MAG: hypothetical protein V3V97_15110 [Hyphomicrobiaceae bacterium]